MKMISLRSLAPIATFLLTLSISAAGGLAMSGDKSSQQDANSKQAPGSSDQGTSTDDSSKSITENDDSDKSDTVKTDSAESASKQDKKQKKAEKKKAKEDAKQEEVQLSPAELKALEAAQERAKLLKAARTPFNTEVSSTAQEPAALPRQGSSLAQRLVSARQTRVYMPGKICIGKATDFVVKGRPGSQVAIAMADKDSGAKSLCGKNLRLGADRKLVAAGTIPETGVLTLVVDMPIQGDLIGLPVFFETAVWQNSDFSDIEIATPVKSETQAEIADKPNAVIVAEEKTAKRGLRLVPDSAVPLHQRGNVGIESGRP